MIDKPLDPADVRTAERLAPGCYRRNHRPPETLRLLLPINPLHNLDQLSTLVARWKRQQHGPRTVGIGPASDLILQKLRRVTLQRLHGNRKAGEKQGRGKSEGVKHGRKIQTII